MDNNNQQGEYSMGLIIVSLFLPIIGIIIGLVKLKDGTGKLYLGLSIGIMVFCILAMIILT